MADSSDSEKTVFPTESVSQYSHKVKHGRPLGSEGVDGEFSVYSSRTEMQFSHDAKHGRPVGHSQQHTSAFKPFRVGKKPIWVTVMAVAAEIFPTPHQNSK